MTFYDVTISRGSIIGRASGMTDLLAAMNFVEKLNEAGLAPHSASCTECLRGPEFKDQGPLYHQFVIKGSDIEPLFSKINLIWNWALGNGVSSADLIASGVLDPDSYLTVDLSEL
jgi:hypothetical protein